MNFKKRIILIFFFTSLIIPIFFLFFNYDVAIILKIQNLNEKIISFIDVNFFLSLFIFIALIATSTALNTPGGSIKSIIAGYYFGAFVGSLSIIISVTLGSFIIFTAYRRLTNKYININKKYYSFFKRYFYKFDWFFLVFIRLIPVIPLSIQNILISSTNITKFKFIFTTFVGISPIIVIYCLIGETLLNLSKLTKFNFLGIFNSNLFNIFLSLILISVLFSLIAFITDKYLIKHR